jgi:hypothetical protein
MNQNEGNHLDLTTIKYGLCRLRIVSLKENNEGGRNNRTRQTPNIECGGKNGTHGLGLVFRIRLFKKIKI